MTKKSQAEDVLRSMKAICFVRSCLVQFGRSELFSSDIPQPRKDHSESMIMKRVFSCPPIVAVFAISPAPVEVCQKTKTKKEGSPNPRALSTYRKFGSPQTQHVLLLSQSGKHSLRQHFLILSFSIDQKTTKHHCNPKI